MPLEFCSYSSISRVTSNYVTQTEAMLLTHTPSLDVNILNLTDNSN